MRTSNWSTMSEEQKQQHRDGEKRRRALRKARMTNDQRIELSLKRAADRARRKERDLVHHQTVAREYKRNGKGYFYSWANTIKSRALKKGILYDLDADFLESIMPTHCPVLGVELKRRATRNENNPDSPTVDRIFPDRGYVRDNVMIVSKRANQIKSDATPDEIARVARYYTLLCEGLK